MILFVFAAFLAHHSLEATYDSAREIRLEGTVAQFLFRNPHSFVHIDVPGENGKVQRYAIEWLGTNALEGQGVRRDSVKVRDQVVITGNPSRIPGDHRVKLKTLRRPADGFEWVEKD